MLIAGTVAASCADVTTSSSVPGSIEFVGFPAPALVVGDTLRDVNGIAVPITAVVRNQQGDILTDAVVRYTYVDAPRDTAILVDSVRGFVFASKALKTTATLARIAAKVGANLQVLRSVLVTTRPDSADRLDGAFIDTLRVATPDTARGNTSVPLTVTVRHVQGTPDTVSKVPNWLVKYEVVRPANPTNDSTKSAFLVNDQHRLSNIDTTDATGMAARLVRVRAALFPTGSALDTVVVRATVSYRGKPVRGAPLDIVVLVIKKP